MKVERARAGGRHRFRVTRAEGNPAGWRNARVSGGLTNLSLPAGDYTVVAYGWSTATGQFDNVRITTVSVR